MIADPADVGIGVREAARRIGCHPTRIYKLLQKGRLRGYRDGRRLRVIESSVVAYQQGNALPTESPAVEHRRQARISRARLQTALEMLRSHGCR
jgi:excisionase family DNA binding protein